MPPRSAVAPAGERARLYREAEGLIERYRARLSPDDLTADDELVRQRAAIMAQIQAVGAAGGDEGGSDAAESIAAVERMIELNRELVAVLQVERARVRRHLADIGESRRALGSYQGSRALSPAFCDRLGSVIALGAERSGRDVVELAEDEGHLIEARLLDARKTEGVETMEPPRRLAAGGVEEPEQLAQHRRHLRLIPPPAALDPVAVQAEQAVAPRPACLRAVCGTPRAGLRALRRPALMAFVLRLPRGSCRPRSTSAPSSPRRTCSARLSCCRFVSAPRRRGPASPAALDPLAGEAVPSRPTEQRSSFPAWQRCGPDLAYDQLPAGESVGQARHRPVGARTRPSPGPRPGRARPATSATRRRGTGPPPPRTRG